MKRLISLLFLSAVTAIASAQTSFDATGKAGTLFSDTPVTNSTNVLYLPISVVWSTNDPINGTVTGDLGNLNLVTPALTSGTLTAGGAFGAGGGFTINIPGYSIGTFNGTYHGAFTSGTWVKSTLANGTHVYILSASFSSTQGSGSLVLQTWNIGSGVWSGSANVSVVNLSVDLP